jgi:hypothetical protein
LKTAIWIQALSAALTAVATVLLLLLVRNELRFYQSQLLDTQRARKIEKMDALSAQFNSLDMLSIRAEAAKSHPRGTLPVAELFDFFERLARSEQMRIVDVDDVDYYFRDALFLYWYGWQDWLKKTRIDQGEDPDKGELYQGYQRLVTSLLTRPGVHQMNAAEVDNLLKYEADRFEKAKALRQAAVLSSK